MEQPNAFIGCRNTPSDTDVANALGPSAPLWSELIREVSADLGPVTSEWKGVYPDRYGWTLRLKKKSRNILYLSPCSGSFRVAFVLSDKALAAAKQAHLPRPVACVLETAPHYPEGNGVRLEVKRPSDLPPIRKLAQIKQAN
jgi:hypothetical protein